MRRTTILSVCIAYFALAGATAATADEMDCGTLENAIGPFDFRDPRNAGTLADVEGHHFNSDVEQLIRGQSAVLPIGDLDYLLRAFPNHPRGLYAVGRYALSGGNLLGYRTAECYFDRALRFTPNDGMVHMIKGIYFMKAKRPSDAREPLTTATRLMPDSSEAIYNLGLLHFELKEYDAARECAVKAYALGYPLPGLRRRLEKLGLWEDAAATRQ
jgi:Flp pilus assembly protein TadD